MQTVTTIGLDIAKSIFQVHGVDAEGNVLIRRQLKRRYVLAFFEKLPPCLVGIEACATSHHPRFRPTKNDRRLLRRRRYVLDGCGGSQPPIPNSISLEFASACLSHWSSNVRAEPPKADFVSELRLVRVNPISRHVWRACAANLLRRLGHLLIERSCRPSPFFTMPLGSGAADMRNSTPSIFFLLRVEVQPFDANFLG